MTDSDWKILEDAFAQAVRIDGDERASMLANFAKTHPELEQQLLDLLAADASDDRPLADPISRSAQGFSEGTEDPWKDRRVGAWTIRRRIADGGMGAVFLAERSDDEYQQIAALKVMAAQLLARDAVTRFRAERQILASLNHPNIAKLIDGGSTDENLPYLVLEYVDGLPIDRYCDEHKLSIHARLAVFLKVCDAVEFAHRNLVVHRDLKPNNILVDQHGEPKLLDFGIAKLLEDSAIQQTVAVTRDGMRAMTPEYASPEQVRGEPPTVVTDVYALGVLLYRMLTGLSPYGNEVTSKQDFEQAIIVSEPKRPSTVVTSHTQDAVASSGFDIGVDLAKMPDRLSRILHGDLDNIVLKSLQKDPDRRYLTVRSQAEDIRNYLAKRPVSARPDSIGYRTGKFLSRNLPAVVASAAVALAAVGMTLYHTARLASERDIAQQERAAAEQITDFLVDIFAATEAGKPDADTVTIREVLDRGADRIDDNLAEQPLIHARLLQHIARTYFSIARYDESIDKYRKALDIFLRETGESAETANAQHRYANAYLPLSDWQMTHDNNLKALQMYRALDTADQAQFAEVLRILAYTATRLGEHDEADGYLNEMLPILESISGPDDPSFAKGLYSKASLLYTMGRSEEAIVFAQRSLDIIARHYGDEHVATVNYRHLLGLVEWERGNFPEALDQYELGIRIRADILGADHPSLFRITFGYGATLAKLGRHEEAAASHARLLDLQRKALGPDNFSVAYTQGAYGMVLMELDRVDEAEAAFNNAMRIWELLHGPDYIEAGVAIIGLGHVALARKDYDTARRYYERGVALRSEKRGADHPATGRAIASLADFEYGVGNVADARALYERALAIYENPANPLPDRAASVRERLAQIEADLST